MKNVSQPWHHYPMATFGSSLLVTGTELFTADRAVRERIAAARSADPEADVVELFGVDLEERPFVELVSGTLFASSVVVYLNDVAYAPSDQFEVITSTAAAPHEGLCLILRHNGGQKSKNFIADLTKKCTDVVKADPPKRASDWTHAILGEAKRNGVRLDPDAADELIVAVGKDMYALAAAIRQLAADHDSDHISVEVVRKYFAGRVEISGFTIADAALDGHVEQAYESVRWAFSTGTSPVLLVSAFASKLRTLGRFIDLRGARLRRNELARELNVPEWTLDHLQRTARSWSPAGVSAAIRAVAEADAGVKGATSDPEFAVERLISQISAAQRM